jgi:transcriptional regulator with XRE-family HTH domain
MPAMKTTTLNVSPLRAFRLQILGLSIDDVAAELGIHKSTYSRIELGETTPTKDNLRAILAYCSKHKANINAEQVIFPEDFMVKMKLQTVA